MNKRMEPIEVTTREGSIFIIQNDGGNETIISIAPEQAEVLAKWLQEAAAEMSKQPART
jgi:hypothetical protein